MIEYEKKIQILENSVEEHKTISQNLQEEQREIEEILKQRNMYEFDGKRDPIGRLWRS